MKRAIAVFSIITSLALSAAPAFAATKTPLTPEQQALKALKTTHVKQLSTKATIKKNVVQAKTKVAVAKKQHAVALKQKAKAAAVK